MFMYNFMNIFVYIIAATWTNTRLTESATTFDSYSSTFGTLSYREEPEPESQLGSGKYVKNIIFPTSFYLNHFIFSYYIHM